MNDRRRRHHRSGLLAGLLVLVLWPAALVPAQQPVPRGFLELVLAVPGKSRCSIKWEGNELVKGGLKGGECTGGLIVAAGPRKLEIQLDDHRKVAVETVVKANETNACAIYLHPRIDPQSGVIRREPRLKEIDPPTGRGYQLRVLSLCPEPQQIVVAKRPVSLDPMQPLDLPGWNGKHTTVEHAGKVIDQFEAGEPGNYVLLVFDDGNGRIACTLFRHLRYSLPPWLRPPLPTPP